MFIIDIDRRPGKQFYFTNLWLYFILFSRATTLYVLRQRLS